MSSNKYLPFSISASIFSTRLYEINTTVTMEQGECKRVVSIATISNSYVRAIMCIFVLHF